MIKHRFFHCCLWLSIFLACFGCRHRPVYPQVGSIYLTSSPTGAEIFINGNFSGQRTPAKIDGLPVGEVEVSLRYFGYKRWRQKVIIKAGEIRQINIKLRAIEPQLRTMVNIGVYGYDMALNPENGKLYIANNSHELLIYNVRDSLLSLYRKVPIGGKQYLVVVNSPRDKIYITVFGDTILVMDGLMDTIVGRIPPGTARGYNSMAVSDDGRLLALSSNDSMLTMIDVIGDSIILQQKFDCPLRGVLFQHGGYHIYLSGGPSQRFIVYDPLIRQEIDRVTTGRYAGMIFLSHDGQTVGICNYTQLTIQAAQVGLWTFSTSRTLLGELIPDACFAYDGVHAWALEHTSGGDPAPPPGSICLIYLPEWRGVAHYNLGQMPIRINQSPDGRYLYILQQFSRDIAVLKTDTE